MWVKNCIEITGRLKALKTTLTTIPGIGDVLAATIISEIGNFDRFAVEKDGAEKLVALAGIDPKRIQCFLAFIRRKYLKVSILK